MSDSIVFITISTLWYWCVQWCDIQADPNISKLGVGYRPLCLLGFLGYVFFQIIIIFTYLSIISSSMTTKDGQRSDLRWPMRCATLSGVFLYFISGLTTFFCNNRHHQRLAQGFTSCHVPYFLGLSPSFSGLPASFPPVPDPFPVYSQPFPPVPSPSVVTWFAPSPVLSAFPV